MQDLHPLTRLLLVLLQFNGVVAAISSGSLQVPTLEITFPAQHSWWQVSSEDGLLSRLHVYFRTQRFRIPEDGYLFVTGDNVPDGGYRHTSKANSVVFGGGIDPGSHFWKMELISWNSSVVALAEATLHVEVVVDVSDRSSSWIYTLPEHEKRPLVLVNPRQHEQSSRGINDSSSREQVLPVCYITSASGAFDGQKRMWLQIMEGLGAGNLTSPVRMKFAVKTFEKVVEDGPFAQALRELNISLQGLPLQIPRKELSEEQTSRDGVVEALLASFYRQFPSAKHDSRLISRLDQTSLHQLQPPFAGRVWTKLVDVLRSPCVDGLIIFSNSRSISDELLVLAARLVGARAVIMELANLHPTRVHVDVLLAPSHFAQNHYSVVRNVRAQHKIVLSTGVSTQIFSPSTVAASHNHFVIGYVGRLTTEKSLGILLAAMKLLAPICPHCLLRIVGDGIHKPWLQSLALEWGLLNTYIEFVDGIYNHESALVRIFREMHVFASPLFTETLGLAVLEAMSVGLPVVGFISGGSGEFLADGVNCVAVTEATAKSFADALLALVNDNERRLRLGRQARRTVEERFSTNLALEQYARLYERVGWPFQEDKAVANKSKKACTASAGKFCRIDEFKV